MSTQVRRPEGQSSQGYSSGRGYPARRRRGGFFQTIGKLAVLLLVLAAVRYGGKALTQTHTITCPLCGATVKEWVDLNTSASYSSIQHHLATAAVGGVPDSYHMHLCMGCWERVKVAIPMTQTAYFETYYRNTR